MEKKPLNVVIKYGVTNVSYFVKKGFQIVFFFSSVELCFLRNAALQIS